LRRRLAPALALALFLAGCAAPFGDGLPPVPVATWAPPAEARPRALIVALHGFNDHKAAFKPFGAWAAGKGVLVLAYDQPGFGERPDRGRWAGEAALIEALDEAVRDARRRYPGLPLYVLGESMGATVAITALARPDAPPVDGLILSAPAVWDTSRLPPGYLAFLRGLAALLPPLRVSVSGIRVQASDNIEMLRALGRDPLYVRDTRIDALAGLVGLMEAARTEAPGLGLPMLILLGARDQIVPPEASRSFVRSLPETTCTVVTYLNGWHLLLRDHQRERVFADVLAWVGKRPLPSGLDHACGDGRPAPS
jgi:alpha-beta hydrolase superfamily lysophospholipase